MNSTTLTPEQLHTLRHMLGINTPSDREPRPYRNYAAVNPGDDDFSELARLGMVEIYRRSSGDLDHYPYDYFRCTDAGRAAALASHRTIRHKRARRVYLKWLDVRDTCCELTFEEFLTNPDYAEARRNA